MGNMYISVSDLEKVTLPKKYILAFFVDHDFQGKEVFHELADFSRWVHIPQLQYDVVIPSKNIKLNPGQEKIVEVQINSSAVVNPANVSFFISNTDNQNANSITFRFDPAEREIPIQGLVTTDLHLTALDHVERSYTLPVYANVTFPAQYNPRLSGLDITHENKLTSQNLPITIDPVTTEEGFVAFWTAYGGPLSLVLGGFAAGFATLVIDRLRKKPSRPSNRGALNEEPV